MPGAEAMTAFTPEADARLAAYLGQVRAALTAAPDVDPAEVEADIREHVETEFAVWPGPVGLPELEAILTRLGPPAAWAGGPARPGWAGVAAGVKGLWADARRAAGRSIASIWAALWRGPEDWRLAYLTLLATILAPLTYGLMLPVAYVLGRAAVALAAEKGVPLGARRWLVYPPLVLVSLPLLTGSLVLPLGAGMTAARMAATEVDRLNRPWPDRGGRPPVAGNNVRPTIVDSMPGQPAHKAVQAGVYAGIGTAALGYAILGRLVWAFPGLPRAVFVPLVSGPTVRFGRRLFLAAFAVLVAWAVAVYPLVRWALIAAEVG